MYALLLSAFAAGAASAVTDSYVLREGLAGYDGTSDTMIMPMPANNNYGAYPSLLVGNMGENERRSLLLRCIGGEGVGMGAFRSSEYDNAALRPQLEVFVE